MLLKKTAVITGGEGGLGESLCLLLISKGFKVFSLDLKQGAKIKNKTFIKTNICDEFQVIDAFKKIENVDLLINNAGIMRRGSTFISSVEDFDLLFSVNLKGVWLTTKYALPLLNKNSQILMISSRHSSLPSDPGLYGLSKKSLEDLSVLLQKEQIVKDKRISVKVAILGPFKTNLSLVGYSEKDYIKRKNVSSKEFVANKVLDLILSKKKKLVFKKGYSLV